MLNNAEAAARDKLCGLLKIENQWGPQMPHIDSKTIDDGVKISLSQEHSELVAQDDKHVKIELDKAVAIVQSYCKLLESTKGTGGREVLGRGELPHPKTAEAAITNRCFKSERQMARVYCTRLLMIFREDYGDKNRPRCI